MFNDHFLRTLSRSRVEDLRARRPISRRRTQAAAITIRHAATDDMKSLERLAALDSRRVPSGELFVAEVDGRLLAATSIDTGAVIADPFEHTAAIVELLQIQARAARPAAALPAAVGQRVEEELLPEAA
ncbi:MAG TPA: hypothetical protein VF080_05495 [Solirubrobacteraceae bacterium]